MQSLDRVAVNQSVIYGESLESRKGVPFDHSRFQQLEALMVAGALCVWLFQLAFRSVFSALWLTFWLWLVNLKDSKSLKENSLFVRESEERKRSKSKKVAVNEKQPTQKRNETSYKVNIVRCTLLVYIVVNMLAVANCMHVNMRLHDRQTNGPALWCI